MFLLFGLLQAYLALVTPVEAWQSYLPSFTQGDPGFAASQSCAPSYFTYPELKGAELLAIEASEVHNFSSYSVAPGVNGPLYPAGPLPKVTGSDSGPDFYTTDFCNVTVTYTHPGWNDTIHVYIWLPLTGWNGKLQAVGGGGYNVGLGALYMTQAVAGGYVAIETDGGHSTDMFQAVDPHHWALTSPGNVNLYLLENYASKALLDLPIVGKAILTQYFGQSPSYSYFRGCSGGGRQAHMIAERFPEAFDGILASAPALNIENFLPAAYWGRQTMQELGVYPSVCEMDAFTHAAIEACDELDGVKDGIISEPDLCDFSAFSVVGESVDCDGTTTQLTEAGAKVMEAVWAGPSNSAGNIGWFGLKKDTVITTGPISYVSTICAADGTCAATNEFYLQFLRWFVAKDPEFDFSSMKTPEYLSFLQLSDRLYDSTLSAASTDLSGLRKSGGKLISFHGLVDEAIPSDGSTAYYQQVLKDDPKADEYFRFFEAPGIGHCTGGPGPWPNAAFDQLTQWVEEGIVPETLIAEFEDGSTRPLCPYPSKQIYIKGDATHEGHFECEQRSLGAVGSLLADAHRFFRPS